MRSETVMTIARAMMAVACMFRDIRRWAETKAIVSSVRFVRNGTIQIRAIAMATLARGFGTWAPLTLTICHSAMILCLLLIGLFHNGLVQRHNVVCGCFIITVVLNADKGFIR